MNNTTCNAQNCNCNASGCNCNVSTPAQSSCGTQSSGDCCPMQKMTDMWCDAFHEAIHQVHVDILKAKIQKAWGAKMEKSADAVIEAKEAEWVSILTKAKSKMDLKEKLKNIMTEGKK